MCPDPFHIAIAVFLVGNVFFIIRLLLFWGKTISSEFEIHFLPHPLLGGTKKRKKIENWL